MTEKKTVLLTAPDICDSELGSATFSISPDQMAEVLSIVESTGGTFDVEDKEGIKFNFSHWQQVLLATEKLLDLTQ